LKVSIITVCLNSEETVRETIKSVLSQSYLNVEYIIIDGGSTDTTMKIVGEYEKHIATIVSENDLGIYDAMNKGLKLATGDIIGILNSDDIFYSTDVLTDVVQTFKDHVADIVFGAVQIVESRNINKVRRVYQRKNFKPWMLKYGWMPPHPATFVRTEVYSQYGIFSLQYETAADYELFVRWFYLHKLNYHATGQFLIKMRGGGVTNSGIRSYINTTLQIISICKTHKFTRFPWLVYLRVFVKISEKILVKYRV
jgi:glycosyltransferase involved in cell wall biosynthesis